MRQSMRQVVTSGLALMTFGMILGGAKTVKAASLVTYNLENANLTQDRSPGVTGELTGTLQYDTVAKDITSVDFTFTSGGQTEIFNTLEGQNLQSVVADNGTDVASLTFDRALTGASETVGLIGSGVVSNVFGADFFGSSGDVTSIVNTQPTSVPEPGTVLGTGAALTMGLLLRRKKRMISVLTKAHSAAV